MAGPSPASICTGSSTPLVHIIVGLNSEGRCTLLRVLDRGLEHLMSRYVTRKKLFGVSALVSYYFAYKIMRFP